ncbi:MAG TPA: outer membrane beta-barrel protein [Saliniramus sp.]|nr:outer membrane beta-barrel protein [Saliniramus sp.]
MGAGAGEALPLRGTTAAPGEAAGGQLFAPLPLRRQGEPAAAGALLPDSGAQTRATIRPGVSEPTVLRFQAPVSSLPAPVPAEPLALVDPDLPPPPPDETPYSPLGLRLGSMTLYSTITQSGGYDTNPERLTTNPQGDYLSRTQGELRLESDWSRHLATARLRGSYDAYRRERDSNRPTLDGVANLHIDITRTSRLTLETGLNVASERPGSPDLIAPVVGRPLITDYYGSANITRIVNRLQFTLRGVLGRTVHEDARLRGGGMLSQRDRDLTRFETTLRTSYDVHPGLLPFVELGADRRLYDRRVGADGLRRSSRGLTGRVGTTFELTRTLVGEASVGYQNRRYDDAGLRRLNGIVADASLEWSLSPVTTLNLSGASRLGETTVAGASGARTQRIALDIRHDLRRHFTITGGLAYENTTYGGATLRERSFIGSTGFSYSFNRWLALTGDLRHERTWSTRATGGYVANLYLLGLRIQN